MVKRFSRYRDAVGLDEKAETKQISDLIYCMGGKAEDVLDSLGLTEDEEKSYETVVEKLQNHFVKKRNVTFECARFGQRTQGSTESVDSSITALNKLSEHCGFGDLRERIITQCIILGIRDTGLSQKLQRDPELTLTKCIT